MKAVTIIILCLFSIFVKAQEKIKDTLFFKFDTKYIKKYNEIPKHYYLDEITNGDNGTFYFKEIGVLKNVKVKKTLSLKKFVSNLKLYDANQKLDDYKLALFFNEHVVYLVLKNFYNNDFIEVNAAVEIE